MTTEHIRSKIANAILAVILAPEFLAIWLADRPNALRRWRRRHGKLFCNEQRIRAEKAEARAAVLREAIKDHCFHPIRPGTRDTCMCCEALATEDQAASALLAERDHWRTVSAALAKIKETK